MSRCAAVGIRNLGDSDAECEEAGNDPARKIRKRRRALEKEVGRDMDERERLLK
jgi:hypothetical protein